MKKNFSEVYVAAIENAKDKLLAILENKSYVEFLNSYKDGEYYDLNAEITKLYGLEESGVGVKLNGENGGFSFLFSLKGDKIRIADERMAVYYLGKAVILKEIFNGLKRDDEDSEGFSKDLTELITGEEVTDEKLENEEISTGVFFSREDNGMLTLTVDNYSVYPPRFSEEEFIIEYVF